MATMPEIVVVRVKWLDSACYEATATFATDESLELKTLETSGFLVRQTKDLIAIAKDYDAENGTYRGVSTIPMVNVVSIKKYGGSSK